MPVEVARPTQKQAGWYADGRAGVPDGMTVNPVQLQKYLGGLDYPVSREDLVRRAQEKGADEAVLRTLRSLPRERFNSPNDVSEAVGEMR